MEKKMYRSEDKMLAGVCGGLAEYIGVDPTLVRLIYAMFSVFTAGFPGVLIYLIAAIIMPKR